MKTDKPASNPNNLIENFLAGLFVILIISGILAFVRYDGTKYMQNAWDSWFPVESKVSTTGNIPPVEAKKCYRPASFASKSREITETPCKMSKSESLAYCSKKFRKTIGEDTELFKPLKTVNDLEKFRELLMKMCMQENGFDY